MIAWDQEFRSDWESQIAIADRRYNRCINCEGLIGLNGYSIDPYGNFRIEDRSCRACLMHIQFYLPIEDHNKRLAMARNCPQFGPVWLFNAIDRHQSEHEIVAMTAYHWLGMALHESILRESFVSAFGLYTLFFEAMLASAWLSRSSPLPNGTLGRVVHRTLEEGFIDESTKEQLITFTNFRNDLVHGDWRAWHHRAGTRNQDVDGRIWQWFFHDDGYATTTRALYKTLQPTDLNPGLAGGSVPAMFDRE